MLDASLASAARARVTARLLPGCPTRRVPRSERREQHDPVAPSDAHAEGAATKTHPEGVIAGPAYPRYGCADGATKNVGADGGARRAERVNTVKIAMPSVGSAPRHRLAVSPWRRLGAKRFGEG